MCECVCERVDTCIEPSHFLSFHIHTSSFPKHVNLFFSIGHVTKTITNLFAFSTILRRSLLHIGAWNTHTTKNENPSENLVMPKWSQLWLGMSTDIKWSAFPLCVSRSAAIIFLVSHKLLYSLCKCVWWVNRMAMHSIGEMYCLSYRSIA